MGEREIVAAMDPVICQDHILLSPFLCLFSDLVILFHPRLACDLKYPITSHYLEMYHPFTFFVEALARPSPFIRSFQNISSKNAKPQRLTSQVRVYIIFFPDYSYCSLTGTVCYSNKPFHVKRFRLTCKPFPAGLTILISFQKSHAHLATFNAILMTDKSSSMAEAPCTVASTRCQINHTDRGQALWTTATRRLGPIYNMILGYEERYQVVDGTSHIACSSVAGHVVKDVETPCTYGVCPYCRSSTCKGNCGSSGGGFVFFSIQRGTPPGLTGQ